MTFGLVFAWTLPRGSNCSRVNGPCHRRNTNPARLISTSLTAGRGSSCCCAEIFSTMSPARDCNSWSGMTIGLINLSSPRIPWLWDCTTMLRLFQSLLLLGAGTRTETLFCQAAAIGGGRSRSSRFPCSGAWRCALARPPLSIAVRKLAIVAAGGWARGGCLAREICNSAHRQSAKNDAALGLHVTWWEALREAGGQPGERGRTCPGSSE